MITATFGPSKCKQMSAGAAGAAMDCKPQHEKIVARACSKLNKLMLPFALLFSIIASIDRANLSFASVSMASDLGFNSVDYGLGSGEAAGPLLLFKISFVAEVHHPPALCSLYLHQCIRTLKYWMLVQAV